MGIAVFSAGTSMLCAVLGALLFVVSIVLAAFSLSDKSHATLSVSVCDFVLSAATMSVFGEVMSISCIWVASGAASAGGASPPSSTSTSPTV